MNDGNHPVEHVNPTSKRPKSFTYRTSAVWTGELVGTLSAEGKPQLNVSTPPEFSGVRGMWTPEEMFVGSVELCHMHTFLAFASQRQIQILSYESHANGVLESFEGEFRFTRIVIFPTIVVRGPLAETRDVHALLHEAERHCLVANSIASIVEVSPTIIVQ